MGWTAPPRRRLALMAPLAVLLTAAPALAQSSDPIGDLLGGEGPLVTAPPAVTEPAPAAPPSQRVFRQRGAASPAIPRAFPSRCIAQRPGPIRCPLASQVGNKMIMLYASMIFR